MDKIRIIIPIILPVFGPINCDDHVNNEPCWFLFDVIEIISKKAKTVDSAKIVATIQAIKAST
jgi:hypothetical protein